MGGNKDKVPFFKPLGGMAVDGVADVVDPWGVVFQNIISDAHPPPQGKSWMGGFREEHPVHKALHGPIHRSPGHVFAAEEKGLDEGPGWVDR